MARDYDSQLLESIAVRRKRLREAVVFGPQRSRRRLDEHITKLIAGLVLTAVGCAGSVGWSYLQSHLQSQEEEQAQEAAGPPAVGSAPFPADWVGSEVTFDMLRDELDAADIPPTMYVLPGDSRPDPGQVDSYFLLTAEEEGYISAGIVEYEQGRTGVEFQSEDEAARWLFQELVIQDSAPRALSAQERQEADELGSALVSTAEEGLSGGGESTKVSLERGQLVDAFGHESGSLLFPDGLPFEERGLPDFVRAEDGADSYHRYRVTYPFQVSASHSPRSEDGPGGGLRFRIDPGGFTEPPELPSIRWLLRNGYLERVEAEAVPD
ncbi:TNT domain-containing protein [Nocardiopsis sp. RSe5-2]|uniref:TNT domain-containing protein n=1 Tax=Nocardiopsis endophytica TaxID=3018445 RepID=A0ABT4TYD9_9ACTN|nr:TNT domain-containing protein [Nocardiopsis endophytica]MDA2809709.1 TNT domain-containing protein [Nocardiopsis endophytica]